jgi:hypothetical protein
LDIHDKNQPLLVSLPKERDKRRGQTNPIKLVPSLCILTGKILRYFFKTQFLILIKNNNYFENRSFRENENRL